MHLTLCENILAIGGARRMNNSCKLSSNDIMHYGVKGMKWGVRKKYDRPYSLEEIKKNYGDDFLRRLSKDPTHKWRAETGIELIHREPNIEELKRIMKNWNNMSRKQKELSDKKSMELFGKTNKQHYDELIKTYENGKNFVNKIIYEDDKDD